MKKLLTVFLLVVAGNVQAQFTGSQRAWLDKYITIPIKTELSWIRVEKSKDSVLFKEAQTKLSYIEYTVRNDSTRINNTNTEISKLQNQVITLFAQTTNLASTINTLQKSIDSLRNPKITVYYDSTQITKFPLRLSKHGVSDTIRIIN